jgi:hypothetical protein
LAQSCGDYVLIRGRVPEDPDGMTTLARKVRAEKRARDLLEENGLPQPDFVEYGFTCIRLFFNRSKLAVIIELDEPEDAAAGVERDVA